MQLVIYPPKRTVYELLSNPFGTGLESTLSLLLRRPDAQLVETVSSTLRLFRRGEPLMILPNVFWN